MKKLIIGLVIAGSLAGYWIGFSLPVPTRDCSETPTRECLYEAIRAFDYKAHLDPSQYYHYGKYLIQAGEFDTGKGLLVKVENSTSLAESELQRMAALQIAEEALKAPEKVASFSPIEELKAPSTQVGAYISNRYKKPKAAKFKDKTIESRVYLKLAHTLIEASAGGGDHNYVSYNEKKALQKFKPNKTWDSLFAKWRENKAAREEPYRSSSLLLIASVLTRVGEHEEAYKTLQLVEPNEQNSKRYVEALETLGKYDEAKIIREQYRPTYENRIASAESAKREGNTEQAKTLLLEAAESLIDSEVTKRTGSKFSGKDKGRTLRRISMQLYKLGDKAGALEVADKSLAVEKAGPISKSFIDYHEIAKHYRLIGQPEKAKSMLSIVTSRNPCSAFSSIEGVAEEYYHLGNIELADKKISQMCGSITVFGSMFGFKSAKIDKEKQILHFWKYIYTDAVVSGKATEKIVEYAGEAVIPLSLRYLAMYYLNHGNEKLGGEYLSKAMDTDSGYACTLAFLANSADREDLLDKHFKQGLIYISKNKKGLERQTAYLQLAACHNLIRIDRLRHTHDDAI